MSSQSPQEPQQPNIQPQAQTPPVDQPIAQAGMFSGRLNRLGYFLASIYIVIYFLVPIVLQLSFRNSGTSSLITMVNIVTIIWGLAGVILIIPAGISVGIRRWHDLNKSGWYMLIGLIPLVGYIVPIILLFFPGTNGSNNYGEPDIRPSSARKVLFNK
jgi:uncharacterized membrane protein YhaH (DUF805 family)